MTARLFVCLASALICACGCGQSSTSTPPAVNDQSAQKPIEVIGTIQWFSIEGGFWAIRGSDGKVYDPSSPLESRWQTPDLPVRAVLRVRSDLVSVHMVGVIVDVLQIEQL